jgi:hypothetical protein
MRASVQTSGDEKTTSLSSRIHHAKKANSGLALITVIIILLFLGMLGAALISMVYTRLVATSLEIDRLQAKYLAEAGHAKALHEISTGLDVFGGGRGNIPATALGAGFYVVYQDPDLKTLTGIGVVRDVRRELVIKYE